MENKYNICVQDKDGVWRPLVGEYTQQQDALNSAYAVRSGFLVILGIFSPPIMVQRWERERVTGTWRPVKWNQIETGIWTNERP